MKIDSTSDQRDLPGYIYLFSKFSNDYNSPIVPVERRTYTILIKVVRSKLSTTITSEKCYGFLKMLGY
jgi:hypothetical protein